MPSVEVRGESIYYAERGRGRALIFIHGAGGNHRNWLNQVSGMALGRRIAPDLPGHGRSQGGGRRSIADYAQLILDFAEALNLATFVAIGHSMGGAIGQYLALQHPQRLSGLVLIDTGARLRVLPMFLDGIRDAVDAVVRLFAEYSFAEAANHGLIQEGLKDFKAMDPRVFHADLTACDQFDVMERLGEIALPTLILVGEGDRLTPVSYARYLHQHIPGSRFMVIPGAGHMVMREQPQPVNRVLEEFIAALPGAQSAVESAEQPRRGG